MFKGSLALLLGIGLFLSVGCEQKTAAPAPASANRVAIVDLDKVAQAVGWNEEMRQSLTAVEQDLQSRWNSLRDTLQTTLQTERGKLPEKPSQEQADTFNRLAVVADNQLRTAAMQVQQEQARVRADLIRQYREQIKPSVRRVAEKTNINIVLLPVDSVLYSDASTDITDKVIDDLQVNKPGSRPVPPKINLPFGPGATPATPTGSATTQPSGK